MPPRSARTSAKPYVSVVLPVHNEEECLEEELVRIRDGLDASPYTWELVLVDDASTDGSAAIADKFPWIRRITFKNNRGPGAARRVGSQAARGQVVVWTDADMTYPNHEIAALDEGRGDDEERGRARVARHLDRLRLQVRLASDADHALAAHFLDS